MPWGDKAVSPCVYTPGAGEMTLDAGLSIVGSVIAPIGDAGAFIDEFDVSHPRWTMSNATIAGGKITFAPTGSDGWTRYATTSPTPPMSQNYWEIIFEFIYNTAHWNSYLWLGLHSVGAGTASWYVLNGKFYTAFGTVGIFSVTPPADNTPVKLKIVYDGVKIEYFYNFGAGYISANSLKASLSGNRYIAIGAYKNQASYPEIDKITYATYRTIPLYATLTNGNAFQPTAPAKLASLPSAVLTLDTTGAAGTVALYLQHYNNEVARWESYSGVANDDTDASFTLIGSYNQATNNIDLPTLPARAGEMVRCRLKFASTDGTAPAPAFVSLSLSWTSDVTAPDAPTISKILSAATADSVPGYRADFGALPDGARHLILEGQLNSGGWLPFSQRAKFEESQGYMRFRGDIAAVEAAGERNEQHISAAKGLALGDVVQVRIAAEDDVGNRSAFTASDALTIAPTVAAVTPALSIEDAVLSTGATGTIRVHLHGPTIEDVTVEYTSADDTATDPNDYTGISGTLTFTADPDDPHQFQDIAINATGDDPTPGTTQYTVTLSSPTGATIDKAEGVVSVQALDYVPVLTDSFTVEVSEREEITVEVS